jgi:penicillin-binding protein 1A
MDQDQGGERGTEGAGGWSGKHRRGMELAGARLRAAHARLMARPLWQRFVLVGLWGGAALLLLLFVWVLLLIPLTPGISDLRQARAAQPTVIVGADGKELTSFEEGVHDHVPLNKISPHVVKALIATEDHRF